MPILRLLQQGKVLILDGAMGTAVAKIVTKQQADEGLNITNPDIIYRIHTNFLEAGANIITTNTFCANAVDLSRCNMQNRVEEVNRAAVQIARKAMTNYQHKHKDKSCFIAGSVGPTFVNISQQTAITFDEMVVNYQQQIAVLLAQNIDLLLLETVIDMENLRAIFTALNNCRKTAPIAVSFAVDATGKQTILGYSLAEMIALSHQFNVDILGVNCASKTGEIKAIPYLNELSRLPLMVYPNAGFPDKKGNYSLTTEQLLDNLLPFVENKMVQIVGGCCGTTPEYIAALKKRMS